MDCSPPGSPIPGILQARVLEWVSIAFSNTAPLVFPKGFGILVDCPALSRCSVPVCSMNSKGISLPSFHQNLIPPSWSLVHFFPHTFQLLAESCIWNINGQFSSQMVDLRAYSRLGYVNMDLGKVRMWLWLFNSEVIYILALKHFLTSKQAHSLSTSWN